MQTNEGYALQCEEMYRKLVVWRTANQNRSAFIQFNYPSTAAIIATVTDALKCKFVVANTVGLELIRAVCDPDEHTVLMLRVVLEHEGPLTEPFDTVARRKL